MMLSATSGHGLVTGASAQAPTTPSIPVPEWLAARFLLRSLEDEIIKSCYSDIVKCFGSAKEMVTTLISASTATQITNIVHVLKEAQSKAQEASQSTAGMGLDCVQSKHSTSSAQRGPTEYFNSLSTDSIFNICEFLDHSDLSALKVTSSSISLIIFDLMRGYKVGVFNMNELIEQSEYRYPLHLDLSRKIKVNYVKPFSTYKTLTSVYSKRYDISLSTMLILQSYQSHGWGNELGIYNNSLCKSKIVKNWSEFTELTIEKRREFFVFDQTKISVLHNHEDRLQTMASHSHIEMDDTYNIALLQYFDVERQRLQNVQFLWLHRRTTLKRFQDYILEDLHAVTRTMYPHLESEWSVDFLRTIGDMVESVGNGLSTLSPRRLINIFLRKRVNASECEYVPYSAATYAFRNSNNASEMDKDFTIITFELNRAHPYWQQQAHSMKLSPTPTPTPSMQPVYDTVAQFIRDQTAKYPLSLQCVHSGDMLWDQISHFDPEWADSADSEHSVDSATRFKVGELELMVTPLTTFGMIKKQISREFVGAVPAEHIEIYRGQSRYRLDLWGSSSSLCSLGSLGTATPSRSTMDMGSGRSAVSLSESCNPFSILSIEANDECIAKNHHNYSFKYEVLPFASTSRRYHLYKVSIYEQPLDLIECGNLFRFRALDPIKEIHVKFDEFTERTISYSNRSSQNMMDWDCKEMAPLSNIWEPEPAATTFVPLGGYSPLSLALNENETIVNRNAVDRSDCTDTAETTRIEMKVCRFLERVKDTMTHPMYGDEYRDFVEPFNDSVNYSLVLMEDADIRSGEFRCFDADSLYHHETLDPPRSAKVQYFKINLLIVSNVHLHRQRPDNDDVDGGNNRTKLEESYPIMVRFNNVSNLQSIGFPAKIWISKQCTTQSIVERLFGEANCFKLQCAALVEHGVIANDESVYRRLYDEQSDRKLSGMLLTLC